MFVQVFHELARVCMLAEKPEGQVHIRERLLEVASFVVEVGHIVQWLE